MADYVIRFSGQDNLSDTINKVKKELEDTGRSATQLEKIQQKFQDIAKSPYALKTQLRDLQKIMAEMNFAGLGNTKEFMEIAEYAGQVQDSISDASDAVRQFSSDTSTLNAAVQAIQGVAAAGSIATGVMSLFGVENEEVAQAILKVQSALAILNGVQAVANVLNKESALMLKLRSVLQTKNVATTAAETVAETANTAATTANTTAEGVNAAGKVANTAATAANTAATNAATTAQLANNAAVLANPYVLAAAAVAALVGGLIAWISSMDEATDSEAALNAAVDAFNEEIGTQMKACAESINLFDKLKKQYDESGDKVNDFSKKLIANKEVQKKLGVTVKTVDDVHKLFSQNTSKYAEAAMARASALAAESAQAALLGQTLAQLTQVYAKLIAGQEVNWRDMRKVVEAAGYTSDAADRLMKAAGFVYESEGLAYGNIKEGTGDLNKLFQEISKGGAIDVLSDMAEGFKKTFNDINEIDFKGMLTSNFDALGDDVDNIADKTSKSVTKHTKNAGKETKKVVNQTEEEIKKLLKTIEGCDAIIQQAQKDLKGLDKNSKTYEKDVTKLNNAIYAARVAKLSLLDDKTVTGLADMKNIIQAIMKDLPKGSDELEKWKRKLSDINEKTYELAKSQAITGSIKELQSVQSSLDEIIKNLPEGSTEIKKWVALWEEVDDRIKKTNKEVDNLKKGIEKGSVTQLQDEIKEIQNILNNKSLAMSARIELEKDVAELQKKVDEMTKGKVTIPARIEAKITTLGSVEDKRKSLQNAQTIINQIQDEFEAGLIKTREEAQLEINKINEQLQLLGLKPIIVHLTTDFDTFMDKLNAEFEGLDAIISTTDSIISLADALKEGANGWEIFKASVSTVESILTSITTVMNTINTIQAISNAAKAKSAVIDSQQAAAATAAATAEQAKAAVDAEVTATSTATTIAIKGLEQALLGQAAASIFAAHASIPFAGVGIASGMITAMMAAMAAQKAAALGLVAFAQGGIVGGSQFEHPILAHKGEMMLNKHQQANLFNAIDGNRLSGNGNGTVTFKIKGKDLYGTLHNFSAAAAKTGIITGIN